MPGVLAVDVDYETHEAVVGIEVNHPVPKDELLNATMDFYKEPRSENPLCWPSPSAWRSCFPGLP